MSSFRLRSLLLRTQNGSILGHAVDALRTLVLVLRARRRTAASRGVVVEPSQDAWALLAEPVRRICIVKCDQIGDLVVAIPAIHRLRAAYPEAHITLVCSHLTADMARLMQVGDAVVGVSYSCKRGIVSRADAQHMASVLAGLGSFDVALDLKVEFEPRFACDHVQARVRACYGDGKSRPWSPTLVVLPPVATETSLHNRELLLLLVEALISRLGVGSSVSGSAACLARLGPPATPATARAIVVNIGAGYDIRCWPAHHFAALLDLLAAVRHESIALYGTGQDVEAAARIVAACKVARPVNRVGQVPLTEFLAALPAAALFIGHDTGGTHAAASLGIPVVCLYSGVTALSRWQPEGAQVVVVRNDLRCAPCGLRSRPDCPHGHVCMEGISPALVAQVCLDRLAAAGA